MRGAARRALVVRPTRSRTRRMAMPADARRGSTARRPAPPRRRAPLSGAGQRRPGPAVGADFAVGSGRMPVAGVGVVGGDGGLREGEQRRLGTTHRWCGASTRRRPAASSGSSSVGRVARRRRSPFAGSRDAQQRAGRQHAQHRAGRRRRRRRERQPRRALRQLEHRRAAAERAARVAAAAAARVHEVPLRGGSSTWRLGSATRRSPARRARR